MDLLPGRSADELLEHPTVRIISRDRFGLDAEGAAMGAPDAQQVADRFHLVLNLSAAIQRALEEQSRQLLLPTPATTDEVPAAVEQTPPTPTRKQIRQQQQRQRRLELYEQVMQLHREGLSQTAIGTALQIQRKTVRRWVREQVSFPSAKRPDVDCQRCMSSPTISASDGLKAVTMPQSCLVKLGSRAIPDGAGWSHSSSPAGGVQNLFHPRLILAVFQPRK